MSEPIFVALEGIDGCGKGVQSRRLATELDAIRFTFPDYETPIGKLIGEHLRGEWFTQRSDAWYDEAPHPQEPLIFQALQTANRVEHAFNITMWLSSGRSVVADRYYASGLVYGAADGIELQYLEDIHRGLPQPTHWILIDIEPEISVERRPDRRDRYETNGDFMRRVCLLYRQVWISKGWPIVDGRGSVEDVAAQIREVLSS